MSPLTREEIAAESWFGDQRQRVLALLDERDAARAARDAIVSERNAFLGERDAARAEVALWRKVTGYEDAEALDFNLGRAGIDYHLGVLTVRTDAECKWRMEAQAEAARLSAEVSTLVKLRNVAEAPAELCAQEVETLRAALGHALSCRKCAEGDGCDFVQAALAAPSTAAQVLAKVKADSREEGYKRFEAKLAEVTALLEAERATGPLPVLRRKCDKAHGDLRDTLAELARTDTERVKLDTALAASQAQVVELGRALADMRLLSVATDDDIPTDWDAIQKRSDELMTRESSTDALREFGMRVLNHHSELRSFQETINDVLKGNAT